MFGPSPTDYGTSLTSIVETNSWGADGDLAEIYARRMNHVYTRTHHGDAAPELFDAHLGQVELVTQARSNHEYEISDLDHYYEFIGGLMSGVERTRGKRPQAVICDTVDPTIHVDDIEDSTVRGLRTRALNPAWIDAMLSHDQHGGDEIAKRFTNVLGLAATAKAVPEWAIERMHECYIDDLAVRERLRANNPTALMSVVTSLLTMQRRSYWHPDQSRIQELTDLLIDLDAGLEDGPHGNNQPQGEHQ
ncbi:cobaltochelatase subunit CobN [Cutibacterium equinum]|uniref:Cobaltochelatase subunit CobN n=1 Tax=Cutibacterium equinum TaxID=3016342 RepID=A0ABY7R034_9ACTN|nr:cobaltochelatase subunit CobN [Cutibacterium equinum]WCC80596.1 cobaltochelatase subunit CobN [Cutibacterium equinum]